MTAPTAGNMRIPLRSGSAYLAALLIAPAVYDVAIRVAGEGTAFGVLPGSLVALYGCAVVAVVSWLRFSSTAIWPAGMRAWLMLGVVVWLFVLMSSYLDGQEAVGAAALVPLTYFLILLKRPSREDCWRAGDAFAWVVVAAFVLLLALEIGHVIPAWYADHGQVGRDLVPFDRGNYWLPLRQLLGLEGRWGGISGFPNIAGQAGALLVVYGLARPGVRRWAFVVAGVGTLVLTDSRTSFAACGVGLLLLAALPGWGATYRAVTPTRVFATVLGLACLFRVMAKVLADPGLTGRLAMWPEFLSLVRGFVPFGVGQRAIDSAIASGDLPAWAHQGHNLFLDTFVRHGLVGLLLTLVFIGLGVVLTIGQVKTEKAVGLAMVVTLIVSCMGDLGIDWTYPSEGLSFLLVAVLIAQCDEGPYFLAAESSSVATSTTSTPSATPSD